MRRNSHIAREAKVSVFENDEGQVGNGGEREGFGNGGKALLEVGRDPREERPLRVSQQNCTKAEMASFEIGYSSGCCEASQ